MKNLFEPIKKQLLQGATPEGLAKTCAAGGTLALFPILGSTTALCLLVGLKFKLNQPVLQTLNYLLYPVQILMIPVFLAGGAQLTNSELISFQPKVIAAQFMEDPRQFLSVYGMAGLHAILVWALIAPFLAWFLYQISFKLLTHWKSSR